MRNYREATRREHLDGCCWYEKAQEFIDDLCQLHMYEYEFLHACEIGYAILAVSSQQTEWERNKIIAQEAIINKKYIAGLPAVNAKLKALREGGDIKKYVRGNKIFSFFQNISGDESVCTIDRHAYSAMMNKKFTKKTLSTGEYRYAERVYKKVAEICGPGYSTARVQAIVWIHYRSLHQYQDSDK